MNLKKSPVDGPGLATNQHHRLIQLGSVEDLMKYLLR